MTTAKKVKDILKKENFTLNKAFTDITQGDAIRIVREKNNLSQNELLKLTGINQSTISSLENNRISPGVERAKVLAKALNVHPAILAFPDWVIAA